MINGAEVEPYPITVTKSRNKEGQKVYTTDILADNVEFLERSDWKALHE